jgi:hypothetical protein
MLVDRHGEGPCLLDELRAADGLPIFYVISLREYSKFCCLLSAWRMLNVPHLCTIAQKWLPRTFWANLACWVPTKWHGCTNRKWIANWQYIRTAAPYSSLLQVIVRGNFLLSHYWPHNWLRDYASASRRSSQTISGFFFCLAHVSELPGTWFTSRWIPGMYRKAKMSLIPSPLCAGSNLERVGVWSSCLRITLSWSWCFTVIHFLLWYIQQLQQFIVYSTKKHLAHWQHVRSF